MHELFPPGAPGLWCPLLTHYADKNAIDFNRMSAHLSHIVPWVKGFLIPGSTGDGWDLTDEETLRVVSFAVEECNSFPEQLSLLIEYIGKGDLSSARELSERLSKVQEEMFALVQTVPWGNQFTNANKAIDHYNAFGPSAHLKEPPMLHAGVRMPAYIIPAAGEILKRYGLMPRKGYLEG